MATAANGNGVEIIIYSRDKLGLDSSQNANRATPVMQNVINYLANLTAGGLTGDAVQITPDTPGVPQIAFGLLAGSSLTGTVGVIINGISLTATAAGGDPASLNLVADVINASVSSFISGIVQCGSARSGTITAATAIAGNTVTISNITLTGVTGTRNFRQFSVDTSNTACAADIAAAINADPVLGYYYAAVSTAAVVTYLPRYRSTTVIPVALGTEVITSSGATLAVTSLAAASSVCISAMQPGASGNSISLIATGTGASLTNVVTPTAAYAAGNRLLGAGAGLNSTIGTTYYGRFG